MSPEAIDTLKWVASIWGPLGIFFVCVGGFIGYVSWTYYHDIVKPSAIQRRINDNKAAEAHLGFINRTEATMDRITATTTKLVEISERQEKRLDEHGEALSWIRRNLTPRDGHNVIE